MTSRGLAPPTDDTVQKLKDKHPVQALNLELPPLKDIQPVQLKKSVLTDLIKKAPRGAAPGLSGWRYEHLCILVDNVITSDLLYVVCCHIAEGKLPSAALPLFSLSRLIALPKHNGDVRPIAIATLRRLTAKAICT